MDVITFRYPIRLVVYENLDTRLIDVVIAYLYGSLDSDIYMKIPEGFKMPEALSAKPKDMYYVKLQRSLYGLKQFRRMWYNRLIDYLISKGYKSNLIRPHVFIKKTTSVHKAKKTELNKTIHITEETMKAKQMLATMSHEIRSP
ncbi:putative RNA-directed DNA polymerase [Tanacetum coccineum]